MGSDANAVAAIKAAVLTAGAVAKIVAPKIGELMLSNGNRGSVDEQLAGSPSVLFDAVAALLCTAGAEALGAEAVATHFVRDVFGHLKAIAIDADGCVLLEKAGVQPDAGVIAGKDAAAFIRAAMTRQWAREPGVRTLS